MKSTTRKTRSDIKKIRNEIVYSSLRKHKSQIDTELETPAMYVPISDSHLEFISKLYPASRNVEKYIVCGSTYVFIFDEDNILFAIHRSDYISICAKFIIDGIGLETVYYAYAMLAFIKTVYSYNRSNSGVYGFNEEIIKSLRKRKEMILKLVKHNTSSENDKNDENHSVVFQENEVNKIYIIDKEYEERVNKALTRLNIPFLSV